MTKLEIALAIISVLKWLGKNVRRGPAEKVSAWLSRKDPDAAVFIVHTRKWIRDLIAWVRATVRKLKVDPADAILEALPDDVDDDAIFFGDVEEAIAWLADVQLDGPFIAVHLEDTD